MYHLFKESKYSLIVELTLGQLGQFYELGPLWRRAQTLDSEVKSLESHILAPLGVVGIQTEPGSGTDPIQSGSAALST